MFARPSTGSAAAIPLGIERPPPDPADGTPQGHPAQTLTGGIGPTGGTVMQGRWGGGGGGGCVGGGLLGGGLDGGGWLGGDVVGGLVVGVEPRRRGVVVVVVVAVTGVVSAWTCSRLMAGGMPAAWSWPSRVSRSIRPRAWASRAALLSAVRCSSVRWRASSATARRCCSCAALRAKAKVATRRASTSSPMPSRLQRGTVSSSNLTPGACNPGQPAACGRSRRRRRTARWRR
jgi:hypothetical protein